ncbi:MAG: type II secretion system secretin GspD [Thiomonas sp.]|uniref:Putative general secretion pathway protein n=1 Tax=mine drainage metagenome TaxID=410659 RepID=E6PK02_9ZZZZ
MSEPRAATRAPQPERRPSGRARRAPAALLLGLALAGLLPPPAWAAPGDGGSRPRPNAPMTINLVNAEIASAVQAVAAATGRNFIVDPRVKGQITLQFEKPVPPQQVYLALLTQLRLAGYAVVEHDDVFKVVPEADARLQTTPVGVGNRLTAIPGKGDQVVTQIFQLRNQAASNLLPVLRPLISPNNTINVDPGSNALVITDYADNLKRLARIIAGLDVPTGSEVDVVPLKYAVAAELAATLQKLIDMQAAASPGAPGAPAGAVTGANGMRAVVLPESSSNALIIRAANGAQLVQIEQMVAKLDRPDDTDNIHVVYLHNANAADLARTLRGVLANNGLGTSTGQNGRNAQPIAQGNTANTQQGMNSTSSFSNGATSPGLGQAPDFAPRAGSEAIALPEGGSVYADTALNALIINAPQPVYQQLRGVIQQLDVRRAQVYVEALIAEVDANKAAQLGIQWQAIAGSAGNQNAIYGGSNFGTGGSNIINLQAGISAGGTAAGQAIASGALSIPNGLNIGLLHNVAGLATLGLLANFLQTHDGANILSAPNLMTLDNEDAKIVVGQNVPFITGQYAQTGSTATVTPFQTVERKDVGLTLKVRPQITAGNTIKMDVYQEVSSIASTSNSAGIITNKRSIQTAVLVNDGQTIVLGGLMQDNVSENNSKIPGLGDIPGIGALFRSNSRTMTKTDLMVFLRPIIVRTESEGNSISQRRYDHMQNLQSNSQLPSQFGMPNLPGPILPTITPPNTAPAAPASSGPAASAATALAPAPPVPSPSPNAEQQGNVLQGVQASQHGSQTVVQLEFAQPLLSAPPGFTMEQPPSIVLDFPGVVSGLGRNVVSFEQGNLRNANVMEAQGRSRVVLSLHKVTSYKTEIQGRRLLVLLDNTATSTVTPAAATPAKPRP